MAIDGLGLINGLKNLDVNELLLMKTDLSIIISHYAPDLTKFQNPLLKTIEEIENQKFNCNIEVIIADDGSQYSNKIRLFFFPEILDSCITCASAEI